MLVVIFAALLRFQPWRIAALGGLLVTATVVAAVMVSTGRELRELSAPLTVLTVAVCLCALVRPSRLDDVDRRTWAVVGASVFIVALAFTATLAVAVRTGSAWWLVGLAMVLLVLIILWLHAAIRSRRRARS